MKIREKYKSYKKIPNALYKKIVQVMPISCVDIIIIKEKKFLLGKRNYHPAKGKWWFPGGRIFKGETMESAVNRIAKQEAGIKIHILNNLGTGETQFLKSAWGSPTHTINTVFLAKTIKKPAITRDNQHQKYQWFKSIHKNWHPYIQQFLLIAGFSYEKSRQ